jgi:hypothetical protein
MWTAPIGFYQDISRGNFSGIGYFVPYRKTSKGRPIMKVRFKNMILGYTGTADDSVFYYSPKMNRYIVRRRPKFKESAHHRNFAAIQRQISALNPSEEYRKDMRDYLNFYNRLESTREHPILNWFALFVKLMWGIHIREGVDLRTITREIAEELPCRSVSDAVAAGYLPKVPGYESLISII